MTTLDPITCIVVMVAAGVPVFFNRVIPFIFFPEGKKTPEYVTYLGSILSFSVMGLLVIYCLRNIQPLIAPHGLPELIGVGCVAALHLWKKNNFISIVGGTVIYMILVQKIF